MMLLFGIFASIEPMREQAMTSIMLEIILQIYLTPNCIAIYGRHIPSVIFTRYIIECEGKLF